MSRRIGLTALAVAILTGLAAMSHSTSAAGRQLPTPRSKEYRASLDYARCMRAHGVPHPDPKPNGNFELTRAQDERLRATPRSRRVAADRACSHYLKGLNTTPLSSQAMGRALRVLQEVRSCVLRGGYDLGTPTVRNLGRGRAFFGFKNEKHVKPSARLRDLEYRCEQQVQLAKRLDRIVAADRIRSTL
jgi:hypothetical protein